MKSGMSPVAAGAMGAAAIGASGAATTAGSASAAGATGAGGGGLRARVRARALGDARGEQLAAAATRALALDQAPGGVRDARRLPRGCRRALTCGHLCAR
ncbi:MAG: hypothetical protein IPJ04_09305 [Candidatus Eisenbacteria bacterium]|nr:hypothetical protein [Candidatus Eisenbacteria bacterium]